MTPPIDALVVTAVPVELEAILAILEPFSGESAPLKLPYEESTYYFGQIGRSRCAVVMTEMGSGGSAGSLLSVADAISRLRPAFVVAIGIAFGRDPRTQEIGDVLVSKQIIPYELQRLGTRPVWRAAHPEAGPVLLNRARNLNWSRPTASGARRPAVFGAILSGEKLYDNATAKQDLFNAFPYAIGGEMEGAGVCAAAQRHKVEWLVVKAICDWGDGTKTKHHQAAAAAASATFLGALLAEAGLDRSLFTQTSPGPRPEREHGAEQRAQATSAMASAYEERERLAILSADTGEIDKRIIDLKREAREGGRLVPVHGIVA